MLEAVATTPSRPFAAMCVVVRLDMIPRSSSWISVVAAREGKTTRAVATDFYTPKVVNFPTLEYVGQLGQRELPKVSSRAGLRPGEGSYMERIGGALLHFFFMCSAVRSPHSKGPHAHFHPVCYRHSYEHDHPGPDSARAFRHHRSQANHQQAQCTGGEEPYHRKALHDARDWRHRLVSRRQDHRLRLQHQWT